MHKIWRQTGREGGGEDRDRGGGGREGEDSEGLGGSGVREGREESKNALSGWVGRWKEI